MVDPERKLTKTLTFGLGQVYGWDVRGNKLVELSDDQRREVYKSLRSMSRIIAQMINILNAREYVRRIMKVPEELVGEFKGNYKPIQRDLARLGIDGVEDIGSNPLSQTYVLGVKADFSGEHGKSLLHTGDRQLPTHRTDGTHPIFVRRAQTELVKLDDRFFLVSQLFPMSWAKENDLSCGWIAFSIQIKPRDKTLNMQLQRTLDGEWDLKNGRIMRNPRKRSNRWLGQVVVAYTPEPFKSMDPATTMGVDLGVTVPACVHIRKNGKPLHWAMTIGRGRDMLRTRSIIKGQIVRIIRSLRSKDSPLHGEARISAREKLRDLRRQEKRVMKTASQKIAARVADTAKRHGAGVWQMEALDVVELKEDTPWLNRNWAPGMVVDAIRWQAEQLGVELRFLDPSYTSQRCVECGHISRDNRPKGKKKAAHFECVNCGNKDHADKNAARNLSLEGIECIIEEAVSKAPNGAER